MPTNSIAVMNFVQCGWTVKWSDPSRLHSARSGSSTNWLRSLTSAAAVDITLSFFFCEDRVVVVMLDANGLHGWMLADAVVSPWS